MLQAYIAALIAGWGRIGAAAIFAALIALIQALIERIAGPAVASGAVYLLLLIVLAVRPDGMFGAATQRRA
jgi:branched-chain amino acid transport system permease protein